MQLAMFEQSCPDCGGSPPQGWIVRGPAFTVCSMANLVCTVENADGDLSEVMGSLVEASRY